MNRAPLIIDPDKSLMKAFMDSPLAAEHEPLFATDIATALYTLEKDATRINGVIVNPCFGKAGIRSVTALIGTHTPLAPLLFICDEPQTLFSQDELRSMRVMACLQKPIAYLDMIDQLMITTVPAWAYLKAANPDARLPIFHPTDKKFSPILASNMSTSLPAVVDVYFRAGPGRFMKILKAGECFDHRLAPYQQASTEFFYVESQAQKDATNSTLEIGAKAVGALRVFGISEQALMEAKDYAQQVAAFTAQLESPDGEQIRGLLTSLAKHEHSLAITVIASMMLKHLGVTSEMGVGIVGLACISHDLGIDAKFNHISFKNLQAMSESDRREYQQHPITGAELLKFMPKVSPFAIRAVEQHHERQNGSGFPYGLKDREISQFAEIVGIADEFSSLIERVAVGEVRENPLYLINKSIESEFSSEVVRAFRKVFIDKPNAA